MDHVYHRSTSTEELSNQIFTEKRNAHPTFDASFRLDSDSTRLLTPDLTEVDDISAMKSNSLQGETEVLEPITLTWQNINVFTKSSRGGFTQRFRLRQSKQILFEVSAAVQPGQLLALMGASGAGKTTLLNALMNRNTHGLTIDGSVFINGEQIGRRITSISAYVQQDDIFIGTLTVREHLIFQAWLRLPSSATTSQRLKRVSELVSELGLKKCQHTKIGVPGVYKGISGGEAKRLALASELITDPSLLFCDEPTTGLDSYMAENVVRVLQRLAHRGKTVICTIHQPASEIYAMFNRVLFLAEGRIAFFGSAERALLFFQSLGFNCPNDFNPADFFINSLAIVPGQEISCRQKLALISDKFEESSDGRELVELINKSLSQGSHTRLDNPFQKSPYKVSQFVQFVALLWRSTINNIRNPGVLVAKVFQKIVMGLFLGFLYWGTELNQVGIMNINGALYFIVCEMVYPALFGVLNFLPSEYPLLVREHHSGMYTVAMYYLSKAVSYIPIFSLDGIVFMVVSYFMVGLRATPSAFFMSLLIGFLLELLSVSVGTMFSAVSPSLPVAISIAGPILTVVSLTSGMYANLGLMPPYLAWLQYVSWFRYGFETFAVNQWHVVGNISCADAQQSCQRTGDVVLHGYSFSHSMFAFDMIMMLVLTVGFHFIGYIAYAIRVYRAR